MYALYVCAQRLMEFVPQLSVTLHMMGAPLDGSKRHVD